MKRYAFAPALTLACVLFLASSAFAQSRPGAQAPATKAAPVAAAPAPAAPARFVKMFKGTAEIEVMQSAPKKVGADMVTVLKIRNMSPAAISLLKVDEYWYDRKMQVVSGDVRFSEDGSSSAGREARHGAAPAGVRDAGGRSSTGLEPNFAAALAYLAGPFSGILILLVERENRYVRFHAWQAVLGLGSLGLLAAAALVFSFLTLLLSPLAFTAIYRLSEGLALAWVIAWVWCLVTAFTGRTSKLPVAGRYAERLATRQNPQPH
jgi:uncharacterized membrane protein